jgi:hypothetical protein
VYNISTPAALLSRRRPPDKPEIRKGATWKVRLNFPALAILLVILAACRAIGQGLAGSSVVLAWDASTNSNVVGYNLYYGAASGDYTNLAQVANVTTATVSNLVPATTYYFAATAVDSAGVESRFSNEVSYFVPAAIVYPPPTLNPLGALTLGENAGPQVVALSGIGSEVAGGGQTLSVTAISSNPSLVPNPAVAYTSPNAAGSLSLNTVSNAVGNAIITVTVNDGQAVSNLASQSFAVTVKPLLIVTPNNQTRLYGAPNPVLTGTLSGLQNGDNITANYNTVATVQSRPGTYAIVPSLNDPNKNLSNYVVETQSGTLTVVPAPLTAAANSLSRTYGAPNPTLTGTLAGVQNGDNIGVSYSTKANVLSPVATYAIVPALIDPNGKLGNYSVALVSGTMTVTPATLTVAASNQSRTYGAPNPTLTGTLAGVQNGDNLLVTCSTVAGNLSSVGTYAIVPHVSNHEGKLANYNVNLLNGTLTVEPALLLVAAQNASRAYGQTNPLFTASFSGFANADGANVLAGQLELSTPALPTSPPGTYPIQATGNLTASNYSISYSNGTLTVTPSAQIVNANRQPRPYELPSPTSSYITTGLMISGGNGSRKLAGCAAPNQRCAIERSVDLLHWTALGTALAGADGQFEFLDSDGTKPGSCFYRVTIQGNARPQF